MELWIPITLAAAFMQNLRSALQKHLKGTLSTSGATFCRFVYAAPLVLVYVAALGEGYGFGWPDPNPRFVLFAMLGGITQITATALLVYLFSLRNFAVGTTYSKTETVQTAVFGLVILGEPVSSMAAFAIVISLAGVMSISVAKSHLTLRNLLLGWTGKAAFIGHAVGHVLRIERSGLPGRRALPRRRGIPDAGRVHPRVRGGVPDRGHGRVDPAARAGRADPGNPWLAGRLTRRCVRDDRLGRLVHPR